MASPQQIGTRIRDVRETLGLTQVELAARIGVHKNQISDWERGKVKRMKYPHRLALEEALGIPRDELVSNDGAGGPAPSNGPVTAVPPPALGRPPVTQMDVLLHELRGLQEQLAAVQDQIRARDLASQEAIRALEARLSKLEPGEQPPAQRR